MKFATVLVVLCFVICGKHVQSNKPEIWMTLYMPFDNPYKNYEDYLLHSNYCNLSGCYRKTKTIQQIEEELRKWHHIRIVERSEYERGHMIQPGPHMGYEVLFKKRSKHPVALFCDNGDLDLFSRIIRPRVSKYTWQKDGIEINEETVNKTLINFQNSSMILINPESENEGQYQCFAHTALGVASSQPMVVRETYLRPKKFVRSSVVPVEGGSLGLKCPVPDAYPPAQTTWVRKISGSHGTVRLSSIFTYSTPDGTLWFPRVRYEDKSQNYNYICHGLNPSVNTDTLVVLAEHSIRKLREKNGTEDHHIVPLYFSEEVVGIVGEETSLYCVFGKTMVPPDWFKDGVNVNGAPDTRVNRYTESGGKRLTFTKTEFSDAGKYTCTVANKYDNQSRTLVLKVESRPIIVRKPDREVTAKVNEDLFLPCKIQGIPSPTVTWKFNASPIKRSSKYIIGDKGIIIKMFKQSDQGYYVCEGRNKHGTTLTESAVRSSK